MKKTILIVLLAQLSFFCVAQTPKITWTAQFPNSPKGSLISDIIGVDNDFNIYSLRRENYTKTDYSSRAFGNKSIIEKHDSKGGLIFSKPLPISVKGFKKIRLDRVFMIDGQIFGFFSSLLKEGKNKLEVVYSFKIDKEGVIDASSYKEVARCNAAPNMGKLSSGYDYLLSEDKNRLLLKRTYSYILFPKNNVEVKKYFTLIDANMNTLWKKDIVINDTQMSYVSEMNIDKKGNLYYSIMKKSEGSDYPTCSIFKYDFKEDKVVRIAVNLTNNVRAISTKVEQDKYTGKLIAHGFYITGNNELGCYAINFKEDFTIDNFKLSDNLYTLKGGSYDFSAHARRLKTISYNPIKGNGGYLVSNVSIVDPGKEDAKITRVVFKLDAQYKFGWSTPIKQGFVKSYFLSTKANTMVKNGKLFFILNSERNLSNVIIDEKGELNSNVFFKYKETKDRMIAITSTYLNIPDNKIIFLARNLLGATANSKASKFGYITLE